MGEFSFFFFFQNNCRKFLGDKSAWSEVNEEVNIQTFQVIVIDLEVNASAQKRILWFQNFTSTGSAFFFSYITRF